MGFIGWTSAFSVGVNEIDNQHKKFFELINKLYDAKASGYSTIQVKDLLRELDDYVKYHFSTEEKLMVTFGYSDYAKHREFHRQFYLKMYEYHKKIDDGNLDFTEEVAVFMRDWLINHIAQADVKIGTHLVAKGIKDL